MSEKNGRNHSASQRDDLTGEHALTDIGQLALAVLFGITWLADSFFFEYTTFLNAIVPNSIRTAAGILILIIAGYLSFTGLNIVFGLVREEPTVIRQGVFALVRHPIYLGEILLYLGFLMFSMSLAAAVVCILAICFLHTVSRYEEKLLLVRFGDEYRLYMEQTPMWFPKLWNRGKADG
ncbi:MAG: isoprenylcysteine carboxylmethyltransferase family protein [Anaerolineales bacterium]|nr:isoprenylcysteine carboxylmethyltransferase family protein [Anaerolineales bacterium]